MSKSAYLLMGEPGCGKTTLLRQVASTMQLRVAGFYTEDLRSSGRRDAFRIVTLEGEMALLAADGHPGPVKVSKYGVDVNEFERVGVTAVRRGLDQGHVLIIDEIGRMQLYSRTFRRTVMDAISAGHPLLATIMRGRNPYADRIKALGNADLRTVTEDNRDGLLAELRQVFV